MIKHKYMSLTDNFQRVNKPQTSASLLKKNSKTWLQKQVETSALIGAILSIIHPEQYRQGIDCLKQLHEHPEVLSDSSSIGDVLQYWSAPFTAMTIISNRTTPYHRDTGGDFGAFDILLNISTARHLTFRLPYLGLKLGYNNGAIIALTSRLLVHGVCSYGERVCMVYHTKEAMTRELLGKNLPLMNVSKHL